MPGIQDIYSVDVSNRYDIGGGDSDAEDEVAHDYDPLDTLKNLEDQKKRAAEEAKKKKQALANKQKNQKKPATRFQENRDTNIPAKKDGNAPPKSGKPPRQQNDRNADAPPRANNRRPPRERQNYGEGDENRRPPRRRNEPRTGTSTGNDVAKGEDRGDQSFGRPAGDYAPRRDRAERYRGGRGGYGGNRGGFQNRGNHGGHRTDGRDDRGKREFDRRSGSDRSSVKATDKRDGAGPRNWGTPGNEIEEEVTEPVGTWQEQPETEEKEAEKETEKTEEQENTEEQEAKPEEPSEMTLDEWKAKQDPQLKPAFNLRKAGEGEDQAKWKDMKVLRKVTKNDAKQESAADDQHKRHGKPQVNVNIQFGDNMRAFGGRGRGRGDRGRGRGRGGRYGGGDRNQRQQHMPDVLNEQEFPTLG